MENEEQPSSENDSQSAEQIASRSQEIDLVDQESPEEADYVNQLLMLW